jgi:VWFA-related protein
MSDRAVRTPAPMAISLVLAAGTLVLAAAPLRAARPVERVALVTVVSETGAPVRDLTAAEFIAKEDGKKREVTAAQLATDPLNVVLMLDVAQPARGAALPTQELRTGAMTFVKTIHGFNPDARIALWQFASAPIVTVDFTNKTDDLAEAITRLFPNQQASAVLLDAVEMAGKQLAEKRTSRRAMVTVDFNSPEGSPNDKLQKAADSITNSGATLWAASVRPGPGSSANREELLDRMTKVSGGKRSSAADALAIEGILKKVAASLTSQYLVTFTSPSDTPARATTFETTRGPKVLPTPFMR